MHATQKPVIDWNEYARCYDAIIHLSPYQRLLQDVTDALQPTQSERILEVGCGTGNVLAAIRAAGPSCILTGIDNSQEMLTRANAKLADPAITLTKHDGNSRLPFANQSFEKVVFCNSLYSLEDLQAVLREVFRVIVAQGTIVIANPLNTYDSKLILRAHAGDAVPSEAWETPITDPRQEAALIQRSLRDETVAAEMIFVARHNRLIASTATFHFLTANQLIDLVSACGFSIKQVSDTYAGQNVLITATKEMS